MITSRANTSFFDDAVLAPAFNVAGAFFKKLSKEIGDTRESSASSTAGSRAGQISLVQYKPLTPKQKIAFILKKVEDGELIMAKGKGAADIAAELSKPEYADKSIKEMVSALKQNSEFLLDDPKLKPAAPKLALKRPGLALAIA